MMKLLLCMQNPLFLFVMIIRENQTLKLRDKTLLARPSLPRSQLLGKVKDFLGVMSEANTQLELDAKDHPENESKVTKMDLILGVADLHTPEAVAAAEYAISSCHPVVPLAADGSETESDESSTDDDNVDDESESSGNDRDDGNNSDKDASLVQKCMCGKENIRVSYQPNGVARIRGISCIGI